MALIVGRTPATDTADDAIQVVDLDDIITETIDDQLLPAPVHMRRRRRSILRPFARPALAGVVGLALLVPVVATVLYLQGEGGSRVDTEDRRQPPAELPLPGRDADVPDALDDSLKTRTTDVAPVAPAVTTPAPPVTARSAATTTAPTTTTTVPPTTASTATTTPSPTLPDGSPNPLGPGPDGPSSGTTTTMPDPEGPDFSVPG
jgi:hypothetical protein